MRIIISALAFTTLTIATLSSLAAKEFSHESVILHETSNPALKRLSHDFTYKDSSGYVWKTNIGDLTDGASIPKVLQPIVGDAFEPKFLRAAVIHDRYCDKDNKHRVRPWKQTHRVFYEMLLVSGVSPLRAKLMYYAVYNFGPRWGYLDAPIMCGPNCIQSSELTYYEKNEYNFQDASFDEWNAVLKALDSNKDITLTELEELGEKWRPNDQSVGLKGVFGNPEAK